MIPSGDISGVTDTNTLRAELAINKMIVLQPGNYYFTKVDAGLSMIPILDDNVSIDGIDWNHTILHMVGFENQPAADWYLFHAHTRSGFTLKNVTIDGSLLDTNAEQTHGLVANYPKHMLIQNVRGQYIFGDTAKLIGSADNVKFIHTEHISNGRSGIAMRSYEDSGNTQGGLTIDGFYAYDVSDQAIDCEPGFEPGEVNISNAKIYSRLEAGGLGITLNGDDASSGARLIMTNVQVYGKVMLYNLSEAIISNCIFDSTNFDGPTLDIRKSCSKIQLNNSILKGRPSDGVISMSVHNSGRPKDVSLNDLNIHIANSINNTGVGINVYDCQDVNINNVVITSNVQLVCGIRKRDVIGGIARGYFAVNGLMIRNSVYGVLVLHTTPILSKTATLSVQNSHFNDITYGIVVQNPEPNVGKYIDAMGFSGNVYGPNVTHEIILGSVFN